MPGAERLRTDGAEGISDVQMQVYVQTMEGTCVYKTVEKSAISPPYMQVTIEDVQVRGGEMAKFHAVIEGDPQPTVAWFKGISLLIDSERVHQFNEETRYSLVLYNTRPEDGGVYTCIAKNTGGEVLCKAELMVQEDKKSQGAKKQSKRRKLHSFYEVKQEIGRGSFGILKRVVHKGNRVSFAAKFIPLRRKTRDQAYQEKDILANLSHNRITQLLDEFETRKTLILILELCSNEELLERLFKKNVVTEAEVKLYIRQLLEGIEYLHRSKVLHLDIKPANILMVYDDKDEIKICDFGFAQYMNPSRPQYSEYGTPEFVSPEILSQSPVSTASDIWPVGVICYLSLTCKSPFAGENDRATLLNIQNATVSWDIPEFVHLSIKAQDFIRKILQSSPQARPKALECLSHAWFMHNIPLGEAHFIETKQLKFFVSRSKWQRSLMSYKSVLVMRPIPEILEKTHKTTSLGISRHLVEESSSSGTSGSSSDNEISASPGRRHFGPIPEPHLSVPEGSNYPEHQESITEVKHSESLLPPIKPARHKKASVKRQQGDQSPQESEELMLLGPEAGGTEMFHSASLQDKAGLLVSEEGKTESTEAGRSPGCVPRHSVVKSTFYSQPSESLANVPSSPGKEHRKHLARAKRTYRKAGFSKSALSGLREPLLEQFELGEGGLSRDEEAERGREEVFGPLMTKSASFDTAQKSPRVTFPVSSRSRSLDDYRMRAAGFAEEQSIEEEESDLISQGSPVEVARQSRVSEAGSEEGSGKASKEEDSKETRQEASEDQPDSFAQLGNGQSSFLVAQQQEKALISVPQSEKERLLQKSKQPLSAKMGTPVPGSEHLIHTEKQLDLASVLAQKGEGEEGQLHQSAKAPVPGDTTALIFPKGESSDLTLAQSETVLPISQDSERGKDLPHEIKLTSVPSKERPIAPQGESLVLLKPAPAEGAFKSGGQLPLMPPGQGQIQHAVMAKGKSAEAPQIVPVVESSLVLHRKPSEMTPVVPESKSSTIPVPQADMSAVSIPGGKDVQLLPQKPSAPSLTKAPALEGESPVCLTVSPAKAVPVSVANRECEGLVRLEATPVPECVRERQQISPQKPSDYSEVLSGALRSAGSVIQTLSQAEAPVSLEATPVPVSVRESQLVSPQKPSDYSEVLSSALRGAGSDIQTLSQVEGPLSLESTPVPASVRESQQISQQKPSDYSEVLSSALRGAGSDIQTLSQVEGPLSLEATPVPASVRESQQISQQKPSDYSEVLSSALRGAGSDIQTLSQVEGPLSLEATPVPASVRESQQISQQKPSDYSEVLSGALRSAGSVIQTLSQAEAPVSLEATPVPVSVRESQLVSPQKPSDYSEVLSSALRGAGSDIQTLSQVEGPLSLEATPVPASVRESQQISQQKPSDYIEVLSSALRGAGSVIQTLSQAETTPISISHRESPKGLPPPKSPIHSKAVLTLGEVRDPSEQPEAVQTLIHEGEHHKDLQQKFFTPGERKRDGLQRERQPILSLSKADPVSSGESQEQTHEKSLGCSELISAIPKGKSPQVLMPSQAKTIPISPFEAEKQELLHHVQTTVREVKSVILKGQERPSVSGFSQAKIVPFSASGGEIPVALKKTSFPIGEGRSRERFLQKPSGYSDMEAEALESLVDEMVCLSKEMTVLAESVSDQERSKRLVSPPRETSYQGSPGQGARPVTRYLVRRGKREGGVGLADPSEADIIYPGEEDCFSALPFMGKKARMSPPYEGMDYTGAGMPVASQFASSAFGDRPSYYPGSLRSGRMYEISLVQIQDLSEDMPRPDSKTAKFDISEIEPAFLNLCELYDIAYSPFEFLSFRKAPENLPGKRRLPLGEKAKLLPGLKFHAHRDKKVCIREGDLQREAVQEAPKGEEKAPAKLEDSKAPWMGKRSDSEGDIPVGSQQIYGLPADATEQRRSSLQGRVGLFKPFAARSQSMELMEQSLKKKMKASVTHLSRMLRRKSSSDQESREVSEERKGELQERVSLTEASGGLKKKTGFPSFTLPSLKTKEKAPSFVEDLTDQTIVLGQSLTLSCRTSAHSSSLVEWFKDGAAIHSTDRILISSTLKRFQLLTILAATSDDFGNYTCVATNSQGTVSTSCVIRKAETPSNPPSPAIIEVLEDGVELAWKPVEMNTPVTYSVLCKKDDGGWKTLASGISDCCYTAKHLPQGLVYSFRFACVSKSGVGPYSNPTAKVKIGETDAAAFQSLDSEEDSQMAASAQPSHQTYAFQTEIKRGRFSIIKQCREKLSGNALAAKIIPYREEDKEAVLQEYHILRKLHHTNVGQLQGAYVSPRHLVLITELCVGPELLNALAGRSSYSEMEVRDYLWQILSAVEYLHAQNILHLDLRSENMIIIEPNLLKLLDFGNAQFYEPDRVITLDGCTDYVETMASELLSDKGAVPQTDIWAIGVTAFIMLSAEYPVSSQAAWDFGRLVKREKIKFNKCYAGLSGGAVSFLQSTLSSNPWRRPTASECLQSPWLQETGLDERQQATVTFSTAKLRNFLAERERKRALLCSKYGLMTV